MTIKSYEDGEVIIPRGTSTGEGIWLVLKGNCVSGSLPFAKTFTCIVAGHIAGEEDSKFQWDVKADGKTDIAKISSEDFENCIGGNYQAIIQKNEARQALKNVHILKTLSVEKFGQLIDAMTTVEYPENHTIVT